MFAKFVAAVLIALAPCVSFAFPFDDDGGGVLIKKKGSSSESASSPKEVEASGLSEEEEYANEFIDIRDAIRLNGTFGPSRAYEKRLKKLSKKPEKIENQEPVLPSMEEVLVDELPRGFKKDANAKGKKEQGKKNSAARNVKAEKSEALDGKEPEKEGENEKNQPENAEKKKVVKSMLLEGNENAEEAEKSATIDKETPEIEEVEQDIFIQEEDPFLKRKDVTDIPFKFRDGEKITLFISLFNVDDLDLWRDLRKNKAASRALADGIIEVVLPGSGDSEIMPLMVYHYAREKKSEDAFAFIDWIARKPVGWLDVKYAGYLDDKERLERKYKMEKAVDGWMRKKGLDVEKLYSDRGIQMTIAKKINADAKKYKKMVRKDKHPAVYVNGRERSGHFESIRSLPMHQR